MKNQTKKRMVMMLIIVGIIFGSIFLIKFFQNYLIKKFMASQVNIVSVSAMQAKVSTWSQKLNVSSSLRAVSGVNVTTELAGLVQTIYFVPGSLVKENELLVQLNIDADVARLHSLQANADLARITFLRDRAQYKIHAISKQILDNDLANLKSLNAQVAEQKAIIAKKTIRAPFSGRLGISAINLGQYLNPGDKIVTLQKLDPIYVDFYVPQQELTHLKVGQEVSVSNDTFPGRTFAGKITTIDPLVDVNTRNVEVEATVPNPDYELTPGMFANIEIVTGKPFHFLTLPQSAITFNPYGDIVYIIKETGKDKKGQPILIANQSFVITGETRGDQIAVLKGLRGGEKVVTSGQLKLKNGSRVAINNSIVPENNVAPNVVNEG